MTPVALLVVVLSGPRFGGRLVSHPCADRRRAQVGSPGEAPRPAGVAPRVRRGGVATATAPGVHPSRQVVGTGHRWVSPRSAVTAPGGLANGSVPGRQLPDRVTRSPNSKTPPTAACRRAAGGVQTVTGA